VPRQQPRLKLLAGNTEKAALGPPFLLPFKRSASGPIMSGAGTQPPYKQKKNPAQNGRGSVISQDPLRAYSAQYVMEGREVSDEFLGLRARLMVEVAIDFSPKFFDTALKGGLVEVLHRAGGFSKEAATLGRNVGKA